MRIALRPVGEDRDDGSARTQPLRDLERGCGGDSGGATRQETFLSSERPAGLEGLRVVDRDHTVDRAAVEDLRKEGKPDALDFMRPSFSSAEDRSLRLGGDTLEPGNPFAQKTGNPDEGSARAHPGD